MSLETSTIPAEGALSMGDAISLLSALPEDSDAAPTAAELAASSDAEAGDDVEDVEALPDSADDLAAAEDDAPDDEPASEDDLEEDDGAGPETATAAPEFWSAEEKALFAKAPAEVQQLVAAKTKEAEQRVYAAKEETAAARQEASIITESREKIDQLLSHAEQVFQGKWDGVDFAEWAKTEPAEAIAAKFEFDAEQELLGKMRTVQAATAAEEHRQFIRAENIKLAESLPELADPKQGPARKKELIGYLQTTGFSPEDLKWAGAAELTVAYKAMCWDKAKADLARKPVTEKPAANAKPPASVRPSGAAPPRKTTIQRQKAAVVSRALQTGRMDDGVAALLALGE